MEQNRTMKSTRQPFTALHAAGLLLLLLTAAAIFFGVHPRYRILSYGILAISALAAWKRSWMFWIIIAVELGFAAFLWTFSQAGYHIVSAIPLAAVALLLVFRFLGKPVKIAAAIVCAITALGLLIIEIPIVKTSMKSAEPGAKYVVVLGAAVYGEEPSITLSRRLDRAILYAEENPGAKLVMSGGQGEGEDISEAECMRRYASERGVAPDRILLEDRSTSTNENLAFSKAVIAADGGNGARVAIVSSGYHLYRAEQTAKKLGLNGFGVAGADGYPLYMVGMYLREALAVVKLWVFGA